MHATPSSVAMAAADAIRWCDMPCVLVTGAPVHRLTDIVQRFVRATNFPTWHVNREHTDQEVRKTTRDILLDSANHKLMVYAGDTRKFGRTEGGDPHLASLFWYPAACCTRTTLFILAESVALRGFLLPLLHARYWMDVSWSADTIYDTHLRQKVTVQL